MQSLESENRQFNKPNLEQGHIIGQLSLSPIHSLELAVQRKISKESRNSLSKSLKSLATSTTYEELEKITVPGFESSKFLRIKHLSIEWRYYDFEV